MRISSRALASSSRSSSSSSSSRLPSLCHANFAALAPCLVTWRCRARRGPQAGGAAAVSGGAALAAAARDHTSPSAPALLQRPPPRRLPRRHHHTTPRHGQVQSGWGGCRGRGPAQWQRGGQQ
eukprot:1878759-Rhodomonas_salina.1